MEYHHVVYEDIFGTQHNGYYSKELRTKGGAIIIALKKFKMLGKDRYKIIIGGFRLCWDFKWHGRI